MLYLILIVGIAAAYYIGKHGLSTVVATIGTELGSIFHRAAKVTPPAPEKIKYAPLVSVVPSPCASTAGAATI